MGRTTLSDSYTYRFISDELVNLRTGLLQMKIPIASLTGNNGMGPSVDVALDYSLLHSAHTPYGFRFDLTLSRFDTWDLKLYLSTGEVFQLTDTGMSYEFQKPEPLDYKIKVVVSEDSVTAGRYLVRLHLIHKEGTVEVFTIGSKNGPVSNLKEALTKYHVIGAEQIISPEGFSLFLTWDYRFKEHPTLIAIRDERALRKVTTVDLLTPVSAHQDENEVNYCPASDSDTAERCFSASQIKGLSLSVMPDNTSADGTARSVVEALVTDMDEKPVQGVSVLFSAGNGALVDKMMSMTDTSGKACCSLSSHSVGTATVEAVIPNLLTVGVALSGMVNLFTDLTRGVYRDLEYASARTYSKLTAVYISELSSSWTLTYSTQQQRGPQSSVYTYLSEFITPTRLSTKISLEFPGHELPRYNTWLPSEDPLDSILYNSTYLPRVRNIVQAQRKIMSYGGEKDIDRKIIRYIYTEYDDLQTIIDNLKRLHTDTRNFTGYGASIFHLPVSDDIINVADPEYKYFVGYSTIYAKFDKDNTQSSFNTEYRTYDLHGFDKFHNEFSHKTEYYNVLNKDIITSTTLTYLYNNTDLTKRPLEQKSIYALPTNITTTWERTENQKVVGSRSESTTMTYDETGNLIMKKNPDNSVETATWYPAAGESGACPAEPNGFTRFVKTSMLSPWDPINSPPIRMRTFTWSAFDTRQSINGMADTFVSLNTEALGDNSAGTLVGYTKTTRKYDIADKSAPFYSALISETLEDVAKTDGKPFSTTIYTRALASDSTTFEVTTRQQTPDGLSTGSTSTFNALSLRTEATRDELGNTVTYVYGNTPDNPWLKSETLNKGVADYENTTLYTWEFGPNILPDKDLIPAAYRVSVQDAAGTVTRETYDAYDNVVRQEFSTTSASPAYKCLSESLFASGLVSQTTRYDYRQDDGSELTKVTEYFRYTDWMQASRTVSTSGITAEEYYDAVANTTLTRTLQNQYSDSSSYDAASPVMSGAQLSKMDVNGNVVYENRYTAANSEPVIADGYLTYGGEDAVADGQATNSVRAKVTDVYGNAMSDIEVIFKANSLVTVTTPKVKTGTDGLAETTLTSTTAATSEVTASAGSSTQEVTVAFVPADMAKKSGRAVTTGSRGASGENRSGNQEVSISDVFVSQRRYAYDGLERLVAERDEYRNLTRYSRDFFDRIISTTRPDGSVIELAYQSLHPDPVRVTVKENATDAGTVVGERTLDGLGRVTSATIGGRQYVYTFELDSQRQPTTVTRPDGSTLTMSYDHYLGDAIVDVFNQTNGNELLQEFSYDKKFGRQTAATDRKSSLREEFSWNSLGQLTRSVLRDGTDASGTEKVTTDRVHSLRGILTGTTVSSGNVNITKRAWLPDVKGRLSTIADTCLKTTLEYDALNRVKTSVQNRMNTFYSNYDINVNYTYDDFGNRLTTTYQDKNDPLSPLTTVTCTFDLTDRVKTKYVTFRDISLNQSATYSYDSLNRLEGASDEETIMQWSYTPLNNIQDQTITDVHTGEAIYFTYNYSQSDPCRLSSVQNVNQNVTTTMAYNKNGCLTDDGQKNTVGYDVLDRAIQLNTGRLYYDASNVIRASDLSSVKSLVNFTGPEVTELIAWDFTTTRKATLYSMVGHDSQAVNALEFSNQLTITPSGSTTDSNGQVKATLVSTAAAIYTVTAVVKGTYFAGGAAQFYAVENTCYATDQDKLSNSGTVIENNLVVTLDITPAAAPADGQARITVTVTVKKENGAAVAGADVVFFAAIVETTSHMTDNNASVIAFTTQYGNTVSVPYTPWGEFKSQNSDEVPQKAPAFNGNIPADVDLYKTADYVYPLGNGYRNYRPALMRFDKPDSESPFGVGGINSYAYAECDPVNNVDPSGHSPWNALLRVFRGLFLRAAQSTPPRHLPIPKIARNVINRSRVAVPPTRSLSAGTPLQPATLNISNVTVTDFGKFELLTKTSGKSDSVLISAHGINRVAGGKTVVPVGSELRLYAPASGTLRAELTGMGRIAKNEIYPIKTIPGNRLTANYSLGHDAGLLIQDYTNLTSLYNVDVISIKKGFDTSLGSIFRTLSKNNIKYGVYHGGFCRESEIMSILGVKSPQALITLLSKKPFVS